MSFFTPPTVAEVKDDSGLRPEQLSAMYTSQDVDTDVAQKIREARVVVENRLTQAAAPLPWELPESALVAAFPGYDGLQRAVYLQGQGQFASLIVKLLALAALYRRAGQLIPAYSAKADEYQVRGMALLNGSPDDPTDKGLAGAAAWVASQQPSETASGVFAGTPRRMDGYSGGQGDEYGRGVRWGRC